MTINTDITNPNLTKVAKYMFFIEQSLYFPLPLQEAFQKLEPSLSETFNPVNVFVSDENSRDYNIDEQIKSGNPSFIYFITCDTRNPRFGKMLSEIKKFEGFIDCYQYDNINSDIAVIRYKVYIKDRMIKLLTSKYSEMYKRQEYSTIVNNKTIQAIYTRFNYDTKKPEFLKPIHVLVHSEEGLQQIIDELNITDPEIIKIMTKNELDSKYSIEQETLTFNNQKVKRYVSNN